MALKYIHGVRACEFRNQAPNESTRWVYVLVQAEVDDKEEAIKESVD